jgi:hypothetical protein
MEICSLNPHLTGKQLHIRRQCVKQNRSHCRLMNARRVSPVILVSEISQKVRGAHTDILRVEKRRCSSRALIGLCPVSSRRSQPPTSFQRALKDPGSGIRRPVNCSRMVLTNGQQTLVNMASDTTESKTVHVRHEDAQAFAEAILQANGVSKDNATVIARGLVQADLRGVDSHGINRIPSYMSRVRNGVLDPKAEPTLTQVTPVVGLVSIQDSPVLADTGSWRY